MQPFQARVDIGAMAMNGYTSLTKAPASDCLVLYSGHSLGESYCILQPQLTGPSRVVGEANFCTKYVFKTL